MKNLVLKTHSMLAAIACSLGFVAYEYLFHYLKQAGLVLFAGPGGNLTSADFAANRVTNPAQSEIVRNTLYDSLLAPAAGQTNLIFFQTPIGQGVTSSLGGVVGSTKQLSDTNMNLAGQLPSGKQYVVESIEVDFLPGSSAAANTYSAAAFGVFNAVASATVFNALNDVNTFYQSGWLEFNILSKNYLQEAPIGKFPPKTFRQIDAGIASNAAATSVVGVAMAKAQGRPYYVEPKITLQPAVNFDVTLRWPGAVANPSGFNGRIMVILDGGFMRASQ